MQKRLLSSLPLLVAGLLGGAGQEIPGFFPGLRWLGIVLGLVVFPFLAAYLGYRASATTGKVGSGGQRGFQIGLIGLGVFLVIGAIDLLARWDALNAGNTFFPDWMAPGLLFLTVVFRAGLLCLVALSGGALGGAIADLTGPPPVPTVPLQHQAGRSLPLPPAVPQGYVRPPQHPRQASRLPPAYLPPGRSASLPPQRPASFPPPFPPTRPKRRRFAAGMVLCLLISFLLLEAGSLAVSSAVSGWWQNLLLSSTSAPLSALTWSGTQFVAVGESGTILTSPDGRSWTGQAFGTSQTLYAITWSGTQSVTVGDGGTILTSANGSTWTAQHSGTSHALAAVAWSGSQFVVVGESGTILTSPDGRTWTARNPDTSHALAAVAWSDTQFVTVGSGGTILTSPDGRIWTARTSGTSLYLSGVAWSGTQFVVVGSYAAPLGGPYLNENTILTSPDGRSWTAQSPDTSLDLSGVTWSGRQFVVVGESGTILTSPDGRIWTAQTSGTSTSVDLSAVAWSGRQFVAVGNESTLDKGYTNTILTSPNGRTWTTVNTGTSSIFPWVA